MEISHDSVTLPPTPQKLKEKSCELNFKVSSQTFMTFHADRENYQWTFQILPLARREKFVSSFDKLSESIKAGGGRVTDGNESGGTRENYTIKILDLEYARETIHDIAVQEMLLPYDCFNSNYIWSQIYLRSEGSGGGAGNVDLNAYRITPSAYKEFDANAVVKGLQPWIAIPSLPREKLVLPISMKRVALYMFSDLLLQQPKQKPKRRIYSRKDSQLLLDKVCELNAHGRVNGSSLYKEIAEDSFNRSWSSLREHFRKTILPHVLANDGYYAVTSTDFTRFQESLNADGVKNKKRKETKESFLVDPLNCS